MFGYNDKLTLTVTNATDREGKVLPFILPLPIENPDVNIPDKISQVSIFEYHEGADVYGNIAFNIYIGEISTIRSICQFKDKIKVKIKEGFNLNIKDVDTPLCYYIDENGVYVFFAELKENDIVVENVDELRKVLLKISNSFANIQEEVSRLKNHDFSK